MGMWLASFGICAGAILCGRLDWCSALASGIVLILLYWIDFRFKFPPTAVRILQTVWLVIPLYVCGRASAALFPDAGYPLYVPGIVLGLGWLLAERPGDGVRACCALIGYFVLAAVGIVSVFSATDLRWQWLKPSFSWEKLLIALSIGCGGMLVRTVYPQAKLKRSWCVAAFLTPTILSAIALGCLSPQLCVEEESAFYTLSRSISLFGVVERFEALIAACLTLGLCSVAALLFRAAGILCGRYARQTCAILFLSALGLICRPIAVEVCAIGTILIWIVLPVIFSLKNKKGLTRRIRYARIRKHSAREKNLKKK